MTDLQTLLDLIRGWGPEGALYVHPLHALPLIIRVVLRWMPQQ